MNVFFSFLRTIRIGNKISFLPHWSETDIETHSSFVGMQYFCHSPWSWDFYKKMAMIRHNSKSVQKERHVILDGIQCLDSSSRICIIFEDLLSIFYICSDMHDPIVDKRMSLAHGSIVEQPRVENALSE